MVRIGPRPFVGPNLPDRAVGRRIDPVKPQQGQMRRESSQPCTVWADLREHAPHRFDPEPIVEIPEDDGPSGLHQAHQRVSLRMALVDAQAEMRGHHADIADRRQQSRRDRPARLALTIRHVDDLGRAGEWEAAQERLAIFAIRRDDRLGVNTVIANDTRQLRKRIVRSGSRIHLLKRDDIGSPFANDGTDSLEIELRIEIEGAVHIPRHEAHRRHQRLPASHVATNCAPAQIASQPRNASASSTMLSQDAFLARSAIWAPRTAMARMPGVMPSSVPTRKSRRGSVLAPATTFTTENGAIGIIRMTTTARMPLPTTRSWMRAVRRPSKRCRRSRPSARPIANRTKALSTTPVMAVTKPSHGPSAAAVAAMSTRTGNTTNPPTTKAAIANGGPQTDCE